MTNIQAPIININGMSADQLMELHITACEALREAIKAVQETSPHGRDFQTASRDKFDLAQAQHWDRLKRLNAILDELVTISTDIHSQRDARLHRKA